jgi:hypothetical protein
MRVTGSAAHRRIDATITLLDERGLAVTEQPVLVTQRRHAFTFGCTGFEAIPLANGELEGGARDGIAGLYDRWLELFNTATLPFYWGQFEPLRGAPDTRPLHATARWFTERGVAVKGHPLCWHTETAPWLSGLTNDEVAAAQVARIQREVGDFQGLIDTWDVINEVVIMPVFDRGENGITKMAQRLGRVGIVEATFAAIGIGINEEANATEPIRFLSLPAGDASNKILAKYGASIVRQDQTTGIRGDTDVIGYALHVASWTKISDRTVSTLLKAWWDNLAELHTIHPQFKKWTKDVQAITNFTVPYHSGAVKFYKEAGVWSAKHDARTKELCG